MATLDFLRKHAQFNSGKIALITVHQQLTYRELYYRVCQLAHNLKQQGVGPGIRVGICAERDWYFIWGILGVLAAGGTYIPLDPSYPDERTAYILKETQPTMLLSQSSIKTERLSAINHRFNLDDYENNLATVQETDTSSLPTACEGDVPAYVMFTSGSTGKPKGVEILRSSLGFYIDEIANVINLQPDDIYLHTASFSFSSSLRQLLVPLNSGTTMVLASREQTKNPLALLELIRLQNVSVSDTVASVWRCILQVVDTLSFERRQTLLDNRLRLVLLSGELTTCQTLHQLRQTLSNQLQVVNIYGQTETVGVCAYPVPKDFDRTEGYLPVGYSYAHNRAYILDNNQQPVASGEIGELYVAGGCVAKGYLNQVDLTKERFIPNPWCDNSPLFARLYKTGDVACQHPDGCIELLGRTDFQVKVRGMRVELGEIEANLESQPAVKEAVVLAKSDPTGNQQLVAYIVPSDSNNNQTDIIQTLRVHLKHQLPDYMIPASYVFLEALPLTPNGKRDRLALPSPSPNVSASSTQTHLTQLEERLATIWQKLLNVEPTHTADFFDAGGHSLLLVQFLAEIEAEFDIQLTFNQVLQTPTFKEIAQLLSADKPAVDSSSSVFLRLRETGDQSPLFCIHAADGVALYYRNMLRYLTNDRPLYAFQSQGVDGIMPPLTSVKEMAELYLNHMRSVQPHGPYHLLGYSLGGVIAYEMAQRLQADRESVAFLCLIDSRTPTLTQHVPSNIQILKTILSNLKSKPWLHKWEYIQRQTRWLLKRKGLIKAEMSHRHQATLAEEYGNTSFLKVFKPNHTALKNYKTVPYSGDVCLITARERSPRAAHDPNLGWTKLVRGNLINHTVTGDHFSIIDDPHLEELVTRINQCLGTCSASVKQHETIEELMAQ